MTIRILAIMEAYSITGPAKNLIEFARRAKDAEAPRLDFSIVTYNRAAGDSTFAAAAADAGIRTHTIFERRRFDMGVLPRLREISELERPDIVQSHNVKSHFFVRLLGIPARLPWVAFNHGYTAQSTLDRMYSQLDYWSLRRAYRAVVVCQPFAAAIEHRGVPRDRIHIQHNSVKPFTAPPPGEIEALRREMGIRSPVLLAVGRLSTEKGHADLLEAVARLNDSQFQLVIVGDGPELCRLEEQIARLRLERSVILAGHRPDVRPFYAAATVLALPSHSEGSPNVVLEAMAAGVPVAATNVGGVPEILEHERTGLIVPPRDPDAMAAAIRRLLTGPQERCAMADAARREVEAHYTPEAYHRSMAAFYQQVLDAWAREK
jgi:glycosyltransferase involved in cell wall biosynthesis